jgi:hypothetical protein
MLNNPAPGPPQLGHPHNVLGWIQLNIDLA